MNWLLNLHPVQLLREEIATYRRVALGLLIAFIVCLPSGTDMWMHGRIIDAAHSSWTYPFTYLLPNSYTGKNIVLALYMLLLLGAGHLSLRAGLARPSFRHAQALVKNPLRQYWVQGFGWFVHTALLCQLALVPLLSSNPLVWIIGLVALAEMFVLAAVPAALASEGGELIDAVALAHKHVFQAQMIVQAQLWGVAIVAAGLWLGFVYLMVRVCLPVHVFQHYHARTLGIAAQMAWLGILPLHAFASVRFTQRQLRPAAHPAQAVLAPEQTSA